MRRLLVAAAFASVAARVVAAQESLDFVNADRETTAQLTRIMESVKAANLPTEPVIAKARFATQVHAPPARLVAALQAVASRLADARIALGPTSPKADIIQGEGALGVKGVTVEMLRQIRAAQPNGSIAAPIGVMTQLVASGVEPKRAAQIVSALVRGRATNDQLVALGNNVSQDVIAGAGAASALQIRLDPLKPLLAYGTSAAAAGDAMSAFPTTGGLQSTGGNTGPAKPPQNPRGRP